ncbi:unnamed protein product [Rotaria sp. Silwood2]|nr:unnamed protein product [Rotaria sp. Silwood2]
MNKPKRTQTLDSFIIKKPKNISTTSCDPDLDQHGEEANVVSDTSIVHINRVITGNANEPTPIVSSENNQLSIQNGYCSLTDSPASNEHCFLLSSTCSSSINDEHIDTSVQTSSCNYSDREKENNNGRSTATSEGFVGCDKLKSEKDEICIESSSRKTTSFQDKWYDDYPLIEYSILKDRIYCFVCRLFGHGSGALCADLAWTKSGLQQWARMKGKDGKLIKHFQSTAHISANERLQTFKKEDSHVDIQLDKERIYVNHHRQELFKLNRYIILSLLDATKFLARQSLSVRAEIESEGIVVIHRI